MLKGINRRLGVKCSKSKVATTPRHFALTKDGVLSSFLFKVFIHVPPILLP